MSASNLDVVDSNRKMIVECMFLGHPYDFISGLADIYRGRLAEECRLCEPAVLKRVGGLVLQQQTNKRDRLSEVCSLFALTDISRPVRLHGPMLREERLPA